MLSFKFVSGSHPGMARENNEDSVAVDEVTQLAVLADGMGGYNAGEVASGMATTFIKSEMSRWLAQAGKQANAKDVRRALEICVDNANRSIFNAANSNPHYVGMGTTLVVGVFQDNRLMLGHIGDSRCYRLRGNEFQQITKDHSLLQEQLDAGLITPEQAEQSTNKNLVTRALGVEDTVQTEVNEHRIDDNDTFLLCSDGLSDMVGDQQIAQILANAPSMEVACQQLIDAANEAGGRDNISVLMVKADASASKRGFFARLLGK
jgi:PPM family protein phosphatase